LGDLPALPERYRDRILREAVDKVGGAVERINNPHILSIALCCFRDAGLFCNEAMIRVSLLEHINNCLLSGLINLADKIIRPLRDTRT
jgi:hypothetical protein